MRLSNQQVEALANKYSAEEKEKIEAEQEHRLHDPEVQAEAKRIFAVRVKYEADCAELKAKYEKAVPKGLLNWSASYDYTTQERETLSVKTCATIIVSEEMNKEDRFTKKQGKFRDWKREIILASIDSETMAELEKKLKV